MPTTTSDTRGECFAARRIHAAESRGHDGLAASPDDRVHAVKHSLEFILSLHSITATTPALTNSTRTVKTEARPHVATETPAPPSSSMSLRSRQPTASRPQQQQPPRPRSKATARADSRDHKPPVKAKLSPKGRRAKAAVTDPESYAQKRLARKCTIEDCTNYTINKGLCFRHGGGKKCTFDGCSASAKIAGLCWKHGGSIQCVVDGCDRRGKSRGRCWAHGGGTKCQTESCEKVAVSNGFCWAHGGGKRCQFDGCQRPAYERTLNFCPKHFKKFESGEEVLEL